MIIMAENSKLPKGKKVKFHHYEKTSGKVTIPNAIAESLGYEHKDEMTLSMVAIENIAGLFICKKKNNPSFKKDKQKE